MPNQTTTIPPLTPRASEQLDRPVQYWLFQVRDHQPLTEVDTSLGPQALMLPPAGVATLATGQNNQNQELIYIKTSADANVATITGAAQGPQTLTAQYDTLRFKSNGTTWYKV